jgi:hypothetical protein
MVGHADGRDDAVDRENKVEEEDCRGKWNYPMRQSALSTESNKSKAVMARHADTKREGT